MERKTESVHRCAYEVPIRIVININIPSLHSQFHAVQQKRARACVCARCMHKAYFFSLTLVVVCPCIQKPCMLGIITMRTS